MSDDADSPFYPPMWGKRSYC